MSMLTYAGTMGQRVTREGRGEDECVRIYTYRALIDATWTGEWL